MCLLFKPKLILLFLILFYTLFYIVLHLSCWFASCFYTYLILTLLKIISQYSASSHAFSFLGDYVNLTFIWTIFKNHYSNTKLLEFKISRNSFEMRRSWIFLILYAFLRLLLIFCVEIDHCLFWTHMMFYITFYIKIPRFIKW